MKRPARYLLAAGLIGLVLGSAPGLAWADPIVEFEGRYWFPELTAQVKSTLGGLGTNIDLAEDLAVDEENLPDLRVSLNAGPLGRFRLTHTHASLSGNRFIGENILFDGTTFAAGTLVQTDFDADYVRLGWLWQMSLLDIVKLGPILEAKGVWGKTSLTGTVPPVKETQKFAFGFPTIGLAMNVTPLDSIDLFAEVSGLPAGGLGYFVDAEIGVKIIPIRFVSIVGGYRVFDIKVESGGDSARLLLHGAFIGATVRF